MHELLQSYINKAALPRVLALLQDNNLKVLIKRERKTRHGDYRQLPDGRHQITINSNLNEFRFLITLIHEVAHLETYKKYSRRIKPHGKEWKQIFQHLMLPFLNPEIFPKHLLPLLANHFKNPKASSDTDVNLALALKRYDTPNDKTFIFELTLGHHFKLDSGRIFIRGNKKVKRYECVEVNSGKVYLFNPNAEVKSIAKEAKVS